MWHNVGGKEVHREQKPRMVDGRGGEGSGGRSGKHGR